MLATQHLPTRSFTPSRTITSDRSAPAKVLNDRSGLWKGMFISSQVCSTNVVLLHIGRRIFWSSHVIFCVTILIPIRIYPKTEYSEMEYTEMEYHTAASEMTWATPPRRQTNACLL